MRITLKAILVLFMVFMSFGNVSAEVNNNQIQPLGIELPSQKNDNFSGGSVNVHGTFFPGFINKEKQARHLGNPKDGRSVMMGTNDDVTNLFNRIAGTGSKTSVPYKEVVRTSADIGLYMIDDVAYITRNVTIHYSNTGAHMVPASP